MWQVHYVFLMQDAYRSPLIWYCNSVGCCLFIFRDEKVVSRAIELNEQLQNILIRHDTLLSGRTTVSSRPASTPNHFNHEEEEEEPEQLFRRFVYLSEILSACSLR